MVSSFKHQLLIDSEFHDVLWPNHVWKIGMVGCSHVSMEGAWDELLKNLESYKVMWCFLCLKIYHLNIFQGKCFFFFSLFLFVLLNRFSHFVLPYKESRTLFAEPRELVCHNLLESPLGEYIRLEQH